MSMHVNQIAYGVLPPRLFGNDTASGHTKVSVSRECKPALRSTVGCIGGENTHVSMPLGAQIDEVYLDLICEDRLQRRPLANVTEADGRPQTRGERGSSLGAFRVAVEGTARMDSRLPRGKLFNIVKRNDRECLRMGV